MIPEEALCFLGDTRNIWHFTYLTYVLLLRPGLLHMEVPGLLTISVKWTEPYFLNLLPGWSFLFFISGENSSSPESVRPVSHVHQFLGQDELELQVLGGDLLSSFQDLVVLSVLKQGIDKGQINAIAVWCEQSTSWSGKIFWEEAEYVIT